MASTNKILQSEFIAHSVSLQRLSSYEQYRVRGFLKKLEADLVEQLGGFAVEGPTRAKLRTTLATCRSLIKESYGEITTSVNKRLLPVGLAEQEFLNQAFTVSMGVALPYAGITEEQITTLISNTWIRGAPSADWWSQQSANLSMRFSNEMRMGYAQGESVSSLVQRIRGTWTGRKSQYYVDDKVKWFYEYSGGIMDTSTRQAEALVRTAVQQISADVRTKVLKNNEDILKGMQWVATLDASTTPLCRERDGLLYTLEGDPIGHSVEFLGGPPAHWNCRSTLVPVTKGFDEILGTKGIDAAYEKELEKSDMRASIDGEVPGKTTYSEWFKNQDVATQKEILGPRKWELWNDNKLSFSQMTDSRGRPLTVEELRKRYER